MTLTSAEVPHVWGELAAQSIYVGFDPDLREMRETNGGAFYRGLFNLTRNLGGAVGLALINTVLNARWDLHLARLFLGEAGRDEGRG